MALSGTVMMPSVTNWQIKKYEPRAEEATYAKMDFIPTIDEGMRPFDQSISRKHTRVSGSTLAQSGDGTGLSYVDPRGTPVTLTPVGSYVPLAHSANMEAQNDLNLTSEEADAAEGALAELTETNALANLSSLTQIVTDIDVTAALIRQAIAKLQINTNGMWRPGGTGPQAYGIFTATQSPALMGIPEVNSAEMRGDSENPYIKGIWTKGFGFMLMTSTVTPFDGTKWTSALYLAKAFRVAWNVRSMVRKLEVELATQYILYNNVGSTILHDLRAVAFQTTHSGA